MAFSGFFLIGPDQIGRTLRISDLAFGSLLREAEPIEVMLALLDRPLVRQVAQIKDVMRLFLLGFALSSKVNVLVTTPGASR